VPTLARPFRNSIIHPANDVLPALIILDLLRAFIGILKKQKFPS
jgi:hypothetical protein